MPSWLPNSGTCSRERQVCPHMIYIKTSLQGGYIGDYRWAYGLGSKVNKGEFILGIISIGDFYRCYQGGY